MATTLYAFYNFTPNKDGSSFYMPKQAANNHYSANKALLNKFIAEAPQSREFIATTYKIYEGFIDLVHINGNDNINISYIAVDDGETVVFYYVDNIQLRSNGSRCYVTIDNWATYINIANITNVIFTRTNRVIPNHTKSIYLADEIPISTRSRRVYKEFGPYITQNQVRFLAILEIETESTASGTISRVVPYIFNPFDQPYIDELVGSAKDLQIEAAIEAIQNIYQAGAGKAQVRKLYIIPSDYTQSSGAEFDTKVYGQKVKVTGRPRNIQIRETEYNFISLIENRNNFNLDFPNAIITNCVGGDMYIGGKYNGLKLPPFIGGYSIKIIGELKQDELNITITNGTDSRDITNIFEIPVNPNIGTLTSLERVAKSLNIMTTLAGGAFQIAAGGAGLISGAAQIGTTFANLNEHHNGMYIPGGSGLLTFQDIIKNNGSGYLFFLNSPETLTNTIYGRLNVEKYGAQCNIQYLSTEENLLNYLYTINNSLAHYGTSSLPYFAIIATINSIPTNAAEEIKTILNSGVRIIFYD